MIGALSLLLLAGSAATLGQSPLAAPEHQHDWATLTIDDEGEGWIDVAWESTGRVDGAAVKLVLVRMVLTEGEGMIFDGIMAVDCQAREIGIKEAWLFQSPYGNQTRAPITEATMDFHDTPLSPGDLAVIGHACGGV